MSFLKRVKSIFRSDDGLPALHRVDGEKTNVGANRRVRDGLQRNIGGGGEGPKIWPIHPDVQREIHKGAHVNMKAVLRGMRRTGKTTILSLLCGYTPASEYIASPEISAGTIFYRDKMMNKGNMSSGAKVELWDVVDEGFQMAPQKCSSSPSTVADARSIDVYRGCHLAAFVIDRTRKETFEYALREARHVPPTTCILLILNFCDIPEHYHVVTDRDADLACKSLRRATTPMILAASAGRSPPEAYSTAAMWVGISAKTGHGIELLRNVFEVPYMVLNVLMLEGRIHSCFQFVEQHEEWLVSARESMNFIEEKEEKVQEKVGLVAEASRHTLRNNGSRSNGISEEKAFGVASSADGVRGNQQIWEDQNGIAKDFFDGIDDIDDYDDDVGRAKVEHSTGDGAAVQGDEVSREDAGGREQVESRRTNSESRSMRTNGAAVMTSPPSSAVAGGSLCFLAGDKMPPVEELDCSFFDGSHSVLDGRGGQGLDDAFFETDTPEELSLEVTATPAQVVNDDDDGNKSGRFATRDGYSANAGIVRSTTRTATTTSDPHVIQADINILLEQMQSVLGTTTAGENASSRHKSRHKSHARQKEGGAGARRRKGQSNGDYNTEAGIVQNNNIDDSYEIIRE